MLDIDIGVRAYSNDKINIWDRSNKNIRTILPTWVASLSKITKE
jgi:hypothetical protein